VPPPGVGFTTLVLPRAAYIPQSGNAVARAIARGSVDLERAGLAQTTMATVEVVAGVARQRAGRRLSFKIRREHGQSSTDTDDARTARA
jgi:hypothetical protein